MTSFTYAIRYAEPRRDRAGCGQGRELSRGRAPIDLAGKTALITGAGGGIGSAVANRLAERGANLALTDLPTGALERASRTLPAPQTLQVPADVTDPLAMAAVVDATMERFERLDIVFANAGIAADPPSTMRATSPATFDKVVEVDLLGVWRTVHPAIEPVIANKGHVLITASIYAFVNGAVNAPYAASKAAVEQLGRALRTELRPYGASAGVLYPGWAETGIARPAFGGDPTLTALRERAFRGALGKAIDADTVARAAVRGMETRAPRVIVPRRWVPLSLLRGVLNPLTDGAFDRDPQAARLLREIDAQRSAEKT
jgi:NAD(P)-dependent dehydrogenase (short-subunit alcohol dehydrogenase family)